MNSEWKVFVNCMNGNEIPAGGTGSKLECECETEAREEKMTNSKFEKW